MFENTLLIIKSDYMSRRKCLLLHLLAKGFQIQGNRKLAFTPEDAAEFYKELADDKCYMLYVILLSKGTSEAFILRKENAIEELLNTMICFFGTSVEMDRNIHVSRSNDAARREITFIFPNYIHEPLPMYDKNRFCKQSLMGPFLGQAYDIVQAPNPDPEMNWRTKLSNWLIEANSALPKVSNQCSLRPQLGFLEKHQQTEPVQFKDDKPPQLSPRSSLGSSSRESSGLLTSTSCVTCSSFDQEQKQPCPMPPTDFAEFEARLQTRSTKTLKDPCKKSEDDKLVCDEHTEWINVYEFEDVGGVEDDLGVFDGAVGAEEVAPEITEHVSVDERNPDACPTEIEEQIDVENIQTEAFDEMQVEEPTEVAPPAEGDIVQEEKPVEEAAATGPATEVVTEQDPAPTTEPEPARTTEPETAPTTEPAAEEAGDGKSQEG